MSDFILVVIFFALACLWLDSMAKREIAIRYGKEISQRFQLQLLDETVACIQLRFARDGRGQLRFKRQYQFEVSSNNENRMPCHLTLLGEQLLDWDIPPYPQTPTFNLH